MAPRIRPSAAALLGAALAVLLLVGSPRGSAALSTLILYGGPGCSGGAATYRCGYHRIPLGGGWKFIYDAEHPLLVLSYPGRAAGRALLSPSTSRYASDAGNCDIPNLQYAQMSC